MKRIQHAKKDFAWVRWTPEDIGAAAKRVIAEKRRTYAAVKKIPATERTFANTVRAIESADALMVEYFKIALLLYVSPVEAVREAALAAVTRIGRISVDFEYDVDLYRALREYEAKQERLVGSDKKLFADMLRSFRRRGFELSEAKREKLKKNLKELSRLGNAFDKNLNDYRDSIEIGADELAGLPESYVKGLPRKGGKYVVTLDYPSYVPFMENAESEVRRRELSEKNARKGGKKNLTIIERMVRLREENAALLGYASHGDFRTENRMAGSADAVFAFLQKLMDSLSGRVSADTEKLLATKAARTRNVEQTLHAYDVAYLSGVLKRAEHGVDDERIREYFPLEHVKEAIFGIFSDLLGVSFERIPWTLWHKDAELYAISEKESGERIAYFALDLYPREGKFGHACMANVISGHETSLGSEEYMAPFATIITNFPKPSASHPSLLSHYEVEVLLHEFGHLMHETLTEAKYHSQAGTSVAWDFVETPSQMFEYFAWEEKILKKLSRHYETGRSMPSALMRKVIGAKRHLIAHDTMKQAVSALYDMMIHTGNLRGTLPEYYARLLREHQKVVVPATSLFPAGFGHLAGGYDAGYYGYLWSRVYAADFFTKFQEAGGASPVVGASYRKEVLAKGSSVAESMIAKAFLGRKLSDKAFLEDIGAD